MTVMETNTPAPLKKPSGLDPFRRAVISGLGVLLPPLLTIVIFLWVANTVNSYLLEPLVSGSREVLTHHFHSKVRDADTVSPELIRDVNDINKVRPYIRLADDNVVPAEYYDFLIEQGIQPAPQSADVVIRLYVEHRFLSPYVVVPTFTLGFILILYLLGKFLAAGVGRIFWIQFEKIFNRLPLVRNVYSSVKQVTDFMFSKRELEYTRVVAVEYPNKDIWAVAFVTGESIPDLRDVMGEPVVTLMVPTSPMPFTGFTVTVKKSKTRELNMTLDQALQFLVSCGVVVPPHLITEAQAKK
jgi:uncharacterized membrane protein